MNGGEIKSELITIAMTDDERLNQDSSTENEKDRTEPKLFRRLNIKAFLRIWILERKEKNELGMNLRPSLGAGGVLQPDGKFRKGSNFKD